VHSGVICYYGLQATHAICNIQEENSAKSKISFWNYVRVLEKGWMMLKLMKDELHFLWGRHPGHQHSLLACSGQLRSHLVASMQKTGWQHESEFCQQP
jgi:glutathionylspermidine synthase